MARSGDPQRRSSGQRGGGEIFQLARGAIHKMACGRENTKVRPRRELTATDGAASLRCAPQPANRSPFDLLEDLTQVVGFRSLQRREFLERCSSHSCWPMRSHVPVADKGG
jgi:hypothetical protein